MSLMLPVQIGFVLFILFAASRAILRFRGGSLHFGALLFWMLVWTTATIAVFSPEQTTWVAQFLGIGRGVDVVIYSSIALLFYLVFRLHVYLEDIRSEISRLIRELSLKDKA
jgi:small membrane protein